MFSLILFLMQLKTQKDKMQLMWKPEQLQRDWPSQFLIMAVGWMMPPYVECMVATILIWELFQGLYMVFVVLVLLKALPLMEVAWLLTHRWGKVPVFVF